MFPRQDRSVGWDIRTPVCLCRADLFLCGGLLVSPSPGTLENPCTGAGGGVGAGREGLYVHHRGAAVVSLWVECEGRKHWPPSETPETGQEEVGPC